MDPEIAELAKQALVDRILKEYRGITEKIYELYEDRKEIQKRLTNARAGL